jgi:hypothetical protein
VLAYLPDLESTRRLVIQRVSEVGQAFPFNYYSPTCINSKTLFQQRLESTAAFARPERRGSGESNEAGTTEVMNVNLFLSPFTTLYDSNRSCRGKDK